MNLNFLQELAANGEEIQIRRTSDAKPAFLKIGKLPGDYAAAGAAIRRRARARVLAKGRRRSGHLPTGVEPWSITNPRRRAAAASAATRSAPAGRCRRPTP